MTVVLTVHSSNQEISAKVTSRLLPASSCADSTTSTMRTKSTATSKRPTYFWQTLAESSWPTSALLRS
jgi:hypothetical protein